MISKEFINLFVAHPNLERSNAALEKAQLINGYVYASNSHIAVKVKEELLAEKYELQPITINFEYPFELCKNRIIEGFKFRVSDLKEALKNALYETEVSSGEMRIASTIQIKLCNVIYFAAEYINRLVKAAEMLKVEIVILKTTPEAKQPALFQVGEVEIMIMPAVPLRTTEHAIIEVKSI